MNNMNHDGKISYLLEAIDKKLRTCEIQGGEGEEKFHQQIAGLIEQITSSLKTFNPGLARQQLKVQLLEKKAWWAIVNEAFSEALGILEAAKHFLEEIENPDPSLVLRLLNFEAFIFYRKGLLADSIRLFEMTREEAKKLPPLEGEKVTNNDLPLPLLASGQIEKAIQILEENSLFFKKLSQTYFFHRNLYTLATCFEKLGQFKKALIFYRQALAGCQKEEQWNLLLRVYNGMANVYSLLGRQTLSLNYYDQAFKLALSFKDNLSAGTIAQNRGIIWSKKKDYILAKKEFNLSITLLSKIKEPTFVVYYSLAKSRLELAFIFRKEKQYLLAQEHLLEANFLIRKEGLKDLFFPLFFLQAQIALDKKDQEKFSLIYPDLISAAKNNDQKKEVEILKEKSSFDFLEEENKDPQSSLIVESKKAPLDSLLKVNKLLEERLDCAQRQIGSFELLLKKQQDPWNKVVSGYEGIIGCSQAMEKVFQLVSRVAPTDLSVVLHGESGTGKELLARAIHKKSLRKNGPWVAINCGALPPTLLESELFGYKQGAFTGATKDKKGLIEASHGGTLFLDEIGELDFSLQVKLLRVLQEREVTLLGAIRPVKVDIRLISATAKDLSQEVSQKRFRQDLYYRLAELTIRLPPLRERKEDIPLLTNFFIDEFTKEQGWEKPPQMDRSLRLFFLRHPWPGNVRELKSQVRVACTLCDSKKLTIPDLALHDNISKDLYHSQETTSKVSLHQDVFHLLLEEKKSLKEIKTILIALSLKRHQFDVKKASLELGICPATLYNWMNQNQINSRLATFESYSSLPPLSLKEAEKKMIELALKQYQRKPYLVSRALAISPATLYQRMEEKGTPKIEITLNKI